MTTLDGKVALVTGSARGIGKAISERLGSLGAKVVINYSADEAGAQATVAAIKAAGSEAIGIKGDMTRVADIDALFTNALQAYGKLDIIVVNAGVELIDTPALDFTEEQFDRLFSINAKGAIFTLQRAGRHVVDNGRIIYIGSSSTEQPVPGTAIYSASKMGARFMVEHLAQELGHRGVAVNSIIPTTVDNAGVFTGGADKRIKDWVAGFRPMPRMATVEDVANAAEYLAGDLSAFVSGQHLLLAGGAKT
ncbi:MULTISPECIES: SDR family oxidoreductase [unclassified Mesorhizobium]|uniref:SDR family NAD(P)-dependent oxidoreductase n=1 Tax=unclassified Mesorhizobium TaxID=325217 RepID=UPI000FDC34DE|nr:MULTISPECIES: SDR family oxidoreductase [unclassified Mesorhizobium]TGQ16490.1 SDR family oxidoreductase [Mesorhizobium sp. M2E.F.Ca.ET.219.01.1.1]TGT77413.1 SDR family oxidoreductase [Mesorhizobium sp. M2E.F.Ca.ET.166.01.1.1]TGW03521.1 SDR family oxidoreductase [Mesorhizobium sp. M2E.F.Ca.ET.154.01.1.1]